MNGLSVFKSKTILFFSAVVAGGVLQDSVHYLQPFLSPDDYGKAIAVVGLIGLVLRVVTSKPLSQK